MNAMHHIECSLEALAEERQNECLCKVGILLYYTKMEKDTLFALLQCITGGGEHDHHDGLEKLQPRYR